MNNYKDFFLTSNANILIYECIEISHSGFSEVYRFTRNSTEGIIVSQNGAPIEYRYCPCQVDLAGSAKNLSQEVNLTFASKILEGLAKDLNTIRENNGFVEKPIMTHRLYRSDALDAPTSVLTLQVRSFSHDHQGLTVTAKATNTNSNRTGLIFSFERFNTLKSFL
jgi:hypothetical protein|nr:MAG TPA: protein of unknown function (DUF1833) [Caudoviricetes sp.]